MWVINSIKIFLSVMLLSYLQPSEMVYFKFTNIKCQELDKPFASFKHCYLKALDRHKVSMNMYLELHDVPINNITVHAQFFHKGNGYRPFIYNNTMDFCEFLKKPSRYMFWKIFFNLLKPYSNLNHTCPINEDIIIKDMILSGDMLMPIPFPPNDYMVQLRVAAYNIYRIEVRAYASIYN
ncbi:uncharacterized protein LOC142240322 [Haematobia irritans]|uniref:uncharacterized protein LOC142240322 n=1 Tax=Haematobia irritans TaxID=7368 RepID=UPI003F4F4524